VNRRELLIWLAAAACGTPQKPRRRPREDAGTGAPEVAIVDDWLAGTRKGSQLQPSPLIVRGEQVARAKEDELEFVDVTTLTRVGYVGEQYLSVCLLGDGRLLGFIKKGAGVCEIDVIAGTTLGKPIEGRECVMMDGAHLMPASGSELYIARNNTLVRYQIAGDHLRELGRVALDEHAQDTFNGDDRMIAAGDGRVLAPIRRAIQVYEVGKPTLTFAGATAPIGLLAFASGGRVWCSLRNPDGDLQDVVVVQLLDGLPVDASLALAPWRVIHMASGPTGALGLLLFDEKNEKTPWTMAFLDETGKERWRTPLDNAVMHSIGVALNLSFVAVTAKRVVLAPPRQPLLAWDAANGTPIK
jgi:hypothetical protein